MYRCRQCSLGFRWPRLDKDKLDSLYSQGNELTWTAPVDSRRDWGIARGWIKERLPVGSRILDVGCFDGGFLEPLASLYRCYGVEIHSAARKRAQGKNIEVVGQDFSSVRGTFDCITAIDVIEHVQQPKKFLSDCLAAVKEGGLVLISTGNLDALTFRLKGSRYWYCTIAEHISFVSPTWFSRLAEALGYRILKQENFAHGDISWSQRTREVASNLLYRIVPLGFRALRKLGMGGKNVKIYPELADHPPSWMSACDHFMVLVQKRWPIA